MIVVTDSETGEVLISTSEDHAENKDAIGTYTGTGVMSGPVYHGVKVWLGPGLLEPDETRVFVEWTDKSSSNPAQPNPGRVHTAELPYPAPGMVARFLVSIGE
jgi:hypothetical protein